jgi:hypothetical protein
MLYFIIAFFLLEGLTNRRTPAQLRKPMIAFGIVMLVMIFTWMISPTWLVSTDFTGYVFLFCLLAILLIYIWMLVTLKNKALHDYARYFLAFTLILKAAGMLLHWEHANEMLILVVLAFAFWVTSVLYTLLKPKNANMNSKN